VSLPAALRLFYRVKPLLPRRMQIALRRVRAARILSGLGGERVRPSAAPPAGGYPWPGGARSAVLLTHDVESAEGMERIPMLLDAEREAGVRSCWNFVAEKYPVDPGLLCGLAGEGHEIGVHGLLHDGRLFSSPEVFAERMRRIRATADAWGARGFRSPSLLHDGSLLATLSFEWDSSVPAWDPFQPVPGGSGNYFPYMLNDVCMELPVTLWQDFTLFEELGVRDIGIWREQAAAIHGMGGLIDVIVHPDYVTDERLESYRELLRFLRTLEGAVFLLPSAIPRDGA